MFGLQQKKEDEKKREKELNDLFKVVASQLKVPSGRVLNFSYFFLFYLMVLLSKSILLWKRINLCKGITFLKQSLNTSS